MDREGIRKGEVMKLLVSTRKGQGVRGNDFCFVPDGDPVHIMPFGCDGEIVDGPCGCKRSAGGILNGKGTTTFTVAEVPEIKDVDDLEGLLISSYSRGGWLNKRSGEAENKEFLGHIRKEARRLEALALKFRPGQVLERRGRIIQRRKS